MKNIILLLITICCFQVINSQNIDKKTLIKIKVKLLNAEEYYKSKEYNSALEKINEIKPLSKEMNFTEIQDLKVRIYIGLGNYKQSKIELDKLYNMSPPNIIIKNIATYELQIDELKIEPYIDEKQFELFEKRKDELNNLNNTSHCLKHNNCKYQPSIGGVHLGNGEAIINFFLIHKINNSKQIWENTIIEYIEKIILTKVDDVYKIKVDASSYSVSEYDINESFDDVGSIDQYIDFIMGFHDKKQAQNYFEKIKDIFKIINPNVIFEE